MGGFGEQGVVVRHDLRRIGDLPIGQLIGQCALCASAATAHDKKSQSGARRMNDALLHNKSLRWQISSVPERAALALRISGRCENEDKG
jgi:hypothetical protein